MASSSRKPLTTYSRRRRSRRRDSDHDDGTKSSPIRPVSPDRDDVSFAVMASRMNKRARLVSRSITTDSDSIMDADGSRDDRPSKRQKAVVSTYVHGTTSKGDYMREDLLPATSQASQWCTPRVSMPSEQSMVPSSGTRLPPSSDQLSPLPFVRRMLSRTSSRNFKENAIHGGLRSLASPFSSRPGSRAPSPGKIDKTGRAVKRRPIHHTKSRTLSQSGGLREKFVDPNITIKGAAADAQYLPPTSDAVDSVACAKMSTTAHSRSSSTPSLKPALDHMSSEPWLIASKALTHSPPVSDSVIEDGKEDMDVDHLSFFADAPLQISTPPRRRRSATVGVWAHGLMPQLDADPPLPVRSFRYDSDVDMSDSSLPGSPSDSVSSRAKPARRRRRTIVHLPSDSLFSSSMDFSALMSETERFPRPPASEGSRSPVDETRTGDVELAPAFSLHSSPVQSTRSGVFGGPLCKPSPGTLGPTSSVSLSFQQPGAPPSSPSSGAPPTQASPDAEGDELLDLFSVLGLDEDEEKWNIAVDPDDSGVAFSMSRSRSHDTNLSSSSTVPTRVRRKRGDTIRASDFPKALGSSSSFDSASAVGVGRPAPRRTRSGTVTQANTAGARKKHEGRPTIKMRTNAEPLRADENEDDELLLKDGDVIE